jgi:MFS family permease
MSLAQLHRLRQSNLALAVYAPAALLSFGQGVLLTTLPLYATSFGVSYGLVSLAVAAAALGKLASDVPAGVLLARLGLRNAMVFGTGLVAVCMAGMALAENFALLVIFGVLSGIGTALWSISRHSFIATAVPIETRGRAISVFGGINRIGLFAGPAAGGFLATAFGLRSSFGLASVFAVVALILALRYVDAGAGGIAGGGHPRWRLLGEVVRTHARELAAPGIAQVFGQMIRQGRQFIIPIYAAEVLHLDPAKIGLVMTLGAILDMSMFIPAGFVMDRFGRKVAAVPSFAVMAVGVALIPLASSFGTLVAVAIIIGLGNGLGAGTMMTLGADLAPRRALGEFLGVWRLIGDAGSFMGPVAVGLIAGHAGLNGSAIVLALIGVMAASTIGLLVRETRHPIPDLST